MTADHPLGFSFAVFFIVNGPVNFPNLTPESDPPKPDAQHLHSSCRRDMFLLVQAFRRRDSYVGYSIPRIASC